MAPKTTLSNANNNAKMRGANEKRFKNLWTTPTLQKRTSQKV